MAILTPALVRLRSGFNALAPDRDKASDGWIGDLAHQGSPSGHNPDESGNAERRDADSIDEVRAIDVDKDLRLPGVTMQMCVRRTIDTPRDRRRLIYIIWNRTIWTKSSGWNAFEYDGSNPHDKHAHFSGDPAYDNDDAPWGIEELMDVTPQELLQYDPQNPNLGVANPYDDKATNPTIAVKTALANSARDAWTATKKADQILGQLATLAGVVGQLAGRDFTDEPAIAAAVLAGLTPDMLGAAIRQAGLTPEAIAAAIPPEVGQKVVDALAARLTG